MCFESETESKGVERMLLGSGWGCLQLPASLEGIRFGLSAFEKLKSSKILGLTLARQGEERDPAALLERNG